MVSADMPAAQALAEEDMAVQMERIMSDGPSETSSVESSSDSSFSPEPRRFGGWGYPGGFNGGWEEEDSGVFSSSWAKDLEDALPTDYDSMLPQYDYVSP